MKMNDCEYMKIIDVTCKQKKNMKVIFAATA